jgi:hypothetical protein
MEVYDGASWEAFDRYLQRTQFLAIASENRIWTWLAIFYGAG